MLASDTTKVMLWREERNLKQFKQVRLSLVPAETPPKFHPTCQESPDSNPHDRSSVRSELSTRRPRILGAVSLLSERQIITSAHNIAALSGLGTGARGNAFSAACAKDGVLEESLVEVMPYLWWHPYWREQEVYGRNFQIGQVLPVYKLSEKGEAVLGVEQAKAEFSDAVRPRVF